MQGHQERKKLEDLSFKIYASNAMRSLSIFEFVASRFLSSIYLSPPLKSVTVPPASLTIITPAAISQ